MKIAVRSLMGKITQYHSSDQVRDDKNERKKERDETN